jgi:hypothetical protein
MLTMPSLNPSTLPLRALPLFFLFAALAGCTHVAINNDTGTYRFGELQVFVDAGFDQAYRAAKNGFDSFGLFVVDDKAQSKEAVLRGRDAADSLVIVKIKEVARNRTSVKIRYGVTGDLAQSQRLFQEIQKRI